MAHRDSAIQLEEKLCLLSQNFFQELKKIEKKRMNFPLETTSSDRDRFSLSDKGILDRKVRQTNPPTAQGVYTVRLEPSLAECLFHSRETSDRLDETLDETRTTFGDKVETVDLVKSELDRRERILVSSTRQIEAYLRAVFYFKKEADGLCVKLRRSAKKQSAILKQMEQDLNSWRNSKYLLFNVINALQSAKLRLEEMVSGLPPEYATFNDLVMYYLVLKTFQKELLDIDMKRTQEEEELARDKQRVAEFKSRVPVIVTSKENTMWDLKSKLKNLKVEMAQLEEQMASVTISRAKDDASWYEFQKWIKKLFMDTIDIHPPREGAPIAGTLNMMERIKDFVEDAFQIIERLKEQT